MRDLRPSLCAAVLALAVVSRPVAAQAPAGSASPTIAAAPVEAMTAKARELYADGLKAFQQQKWPEAYAAFTGAWALQKHYAVAGNLGAAEVQLGRHRDAAEHLAIYTRGMAGDPKRTAKERESAKLLYEIATAKVVTVTVSVSVAGADVWIDGARAGAAPLEGPVFVEPGKHAVEVRLDGYVTDKRSFEAAAGEKKALEVTLSKRVDVVPTATATATVPVPERPTLVPVFVLGGLTVAGVAIGAGLLASASTKAGEAEALQKSLLTAGSTVCTGSTPPPDCARFAALIGDSDALGNAGAWSLIGAGVAAAVAVTYVLVTRTKPPNTANVRLLISSTAAGVTAGGAW